MFLIILKKVENNIFYLLLWPLLHSYGNWQNLKGLLGQDVVILFSVSPDLKVEAQSFKDSVGHLGNLKAKCNLKHCSNSSILLFCPVLIYL